MRRLPAACAVLAGCAAPPSYIADVHYDSGGNLVAERCQFDDRGRATNNCTSEDIEQPGQFSTPTDPPVLARAEREANKPLETRPAPTSASVARAIASPGVHRAVELCRAQLAPALPRFSFTLAVAPTGEMTVTPHDDPFAACASRALQGANVLAYDGEPVSFEETLVFDGAPGA